MPDYVFGLCELLHITPFAFSSVGQKRDRGAHTHTRRHFSLAAGRLILGWIKGDAVMTGDAVCLRYRPGFYFA